MLAAARAQLDAKSVTPALQEVLARTGPTGHSLLPKLTRLQGAPASRETASAQSWRRSMQASEEGGSSELAVLPQGA